MSLGRVAERVAKRFARRCWWASLDDLRQEALLACLSAERTWDPGVGVPLDAYAWTCAWRAVGAFLLRNSGPASAPCHQIGALAGLHAAPLDAAPADVAPWADAALADKRWQALVREQVRAALAAGGMTVEDQRLALEVLAVGRRPSEVARVRSVPIAQVKLARRRAVRLVSQDLRCYRLWQECQE